MKSDGYDFNINSIWGETNIVFEEFSLKIDGNNYFQQDEVIILEIIRIKLTELVLFLLPIIDKLLPIIL